MLLFWALVIIGLISLVGRRVSRLTAYSVSPSRTQPLVIDLGHGVTVNSDGPVYSEYFKGDFLPASIRIEHREKVYYLDPFLIGTVKVADAVMITHDHPDHFSPRDIAQVYRSGHTRIIAPRSVADRLPQYPVEILKPGESMELDECVVTGVWAHATGIPTHPLRADYLGFLLSCASVRIYHAGDTHVLPIFIDLIDLDLAVLPINGGLLTMTTPQAAALVKQIRPRMVFPLHYPLGKKEGNAFSSLVGDASSVILYPEENGPS